jgi:soluble lytic murein transglycosylase-like protein
MRYWFRAETDAIAAKYRLEPDLVIAMAIVESAGLPSAFRYEPSFWLRYMSGKVEWEGEQPERVSASYGLLQVMYPVARELGYPRTEPPEGLFVPMIGLEYGCRAFAERLAWAKGDTRKAVAAYNGGKGNWTGVLAQKHTRKVFDALADIQAGRIDW